MTSERACYVFVVLPGKTGFTVAGRLRISETRAGSALGEFVYGRSYLDHPDAVALDPVELRLAERVYRTGRMGGFFGVVRDSMPDYWGRLLIERRSDRTILEEFDYLMLGPDDRAGALGFSRQLEPPRPRRRFNAVVDLSQLQAAAHALLADKFEVTGAVADRARELLLAGTSMGGARPKAVVEAGGALWMAKFGQETERWNLPRVEHGLLRLARRCGLDAVESRVERVGDRDALLVRRFDREWAGDGYLRHRMASALTLLRADDSPTGRGRWSYLALADEVRRTSASPREDLRELFGRMCFNAAVSNLDDHPRNHAMLARGRNWRLSPAYDLEPMPVVAVERRDLAMVCGPRGRWANRSNLLASAGRFLLERDEAGNTFHRLTETIRGSWRETMRRAGVSGRDRERIRDAFLYDGLFLDAD